MSSNCNSLPHPFRLSCILLALSFGAGCGSENQSSGSVPQRSLKLLNAGIPNDDVTGAELQVWDAEASKFLATRGESGAYWKSCELQSAWRIPPCQELPAGGTVLDGYCEGRPSCEAERRDFRIVVICVGGQARLTIEVTNGGARSLTLWSLPECSSLMMILCGKDWRAASSLDVVALESDSGQVQTVFNTGGEEDCDEVGYQLTSRTPTVLTICGIRSAKWPGYKTAVERLERRFGISVVLK